MTADPQAEHQRRAADVAAYALRALEPDEARALERHVDSCALCREELGKLQPAVDALAVGVPPMRAPFALRDRLMPVFNREAQLLRAAGAEADRPAPARRRPLGGVAPALAGTGLLAAGVAAGALLFTGGGGSQLRPVSVAQSLGPGMRATVRVGSGRAELQLSGMPNPPAGRVWQLWIQRDGQAPKPGPVFELGSGAVALPAGAAARGARVMVTDESPGGSARPSTQPVLVARL